LIHCLRPGCYSEVSIPDEIISVITSIRLLLKIPKPADQKVQALTQIFDAVNNDISTAFSFKYNDQYLQIAAEQSSMDYIYPQIQLHCSDHKHRHSYRALMKHFKK